MPANQDLAFRELFFKNAALRLRGHVPISSGFWGVGVREGAVRWRPSGSGHRKGTMRLYFPAGPGRFEQLQLSHEPPQISVLAVRSY